MSDYTLLTTFPGESDFGLFTAVTAECYAPDRLRLQQTDASPNKMYLLTCLVLLRNDRAVARCAIFRNPHIRYNNQETALIGHYECENTPETAHFLLKEAFDYIRQQGCSYVIGPMNGSTWESYRFSDHHDQPFFLTENDHQLYYNDQFKNEGFEPIAGYTSSFNRDIPTDTPQLLERDRYFTEAGVRIRSIDPKQLEQELEKLYPLVTGAFANNFLYSPITCEQFCTGYLRAKSIINPDYVLIAENSSGEAIAFIFAFTNAYCTTEKQLVVKTIARHPDKQWAGIGHVIVNRTLRKAKENGHTALIHAFMIREGSSTTISGSFNGEVYKSYTLYGKQL